MIHRWLGFLVLRRAYRLLVADDPRPLRERLTREAKRILIAAAVTGIVLLALVAAAFVTLVWLAT